MTSPTARIGITDCMQEDKFVQYVDWLRGVDASLSIVKLSYKDKNSTHTNGVDGIVLTGGGDVHPRYYDKAHELDRTRGVDEARDEFEFGVLRRSLDHDLPVLGVCRGMQLANVYLGGSLHVDLATANFRNHESPPGGVHRHQVKAERNSLMSILFEAIEQSVNSYHHQAVDTVGNGLIAVARSPDGVVEAAEWKVKEGMSFLALVQWHPERSVLDQLSRRLASQFLKEVYRTKTISSQRTSAS